MILHYGLSFFLCHSYSLWLSVSVCRLKPVKFSSVSLPLFDSTKMCCLSVCETPQTAYTNTQRVAAVTIFNRPLQIFFIDRELESTVSSWRCYHTPFISPLYSIDLIYASALVWNSSHHSNHVSTFLESYEENLTGNSFIWTSAILNLFRAVLSRSRFKLSWMPHWPALCVTLVVAGTWNLKFTQPSLCLSVHLFSHFLFESLWLADFVVLVLVLRNLWLTVTF